MDSVQPGEEIELNRSEKTVITDAFTWYINEYEWCELTDDEQEQLSEITEYAEENSRLKVMPGLDMIIIEDILPSFGQELKGYIDNSDNPKDAGDFYREQFESIKEKVEDSQSNPFY